MAMRETRTRNADRARGASRGTLGRIVAWGRRRPVTLGLAAGAVALGAAAVYNTRAAAAAERRTPPRGRFLDIDGVRLHYMERGSGPAVVLVHGNGSMLQDFDSSGLIDRAAVRHRVIAFDRPGFGYTSRPRGRVWTAARQADLLLAGMERLGVGPAIVLGHSWGASVAFAMALRRPEAVRGLVLASGYHQPGARLDFLALSGPGVPVIGDLMSHTVAPLLGRLMWPVMMRQIFGPAHTPAAFQGEIKELALRPSQIRASAAESAMLIPTAAAQSRHRRELTMPLVILSGDKDRLLRVESQSGELHDRLPESQLRTVPGAGHMVHHADPDAVLAAIEELEAA